MLYHPHLGGCGGASGSSLAENLELFEEVRLTRVYGPAESGRKKSCRGGCLCVGTAEAGRSGAFEGEPLFFGLAEELSRYIDRKAPVTACMALEAFSALFLSG